MSTIAIKKYNICLNNNNNNIIINVNQKITQKTLLPTYHILYIVIYIITIFIAFDDDDHNHNHNHNHNP